MEPLNTANKLDVRTLSKSYGTKTILDRISFTVKGGEFLSVLGPSGCGKTTLLRILMGISKPTAGQLIKDGDEITKLDPSKRGMGIVFQNYALFPNMTVLQNVEYALKFQPKWKNNTRGIALEALEQVGMMDHLNKKPHKLSGGQQQRVAIARTLALKPDIILFDEPMSALDAANRLALRAQLKLIQKECSITMIYITHDQEEAFTLSDRIMVMREGHIEQLDTPYELYHHPKNEYVEEFVVGHLRTKLSSLLECMGLSI